MRQREREGRARANPSEIKEAKSDERAREAAGMRRREGEERREGKGESRGSKTISAVPAAPLTALAFT
eukprot:2261372-Pleurochrysis_carterae.AAC.1